MIQQKSKNSGNRHRNLSSAGAAAALAALLLLAACSTGSDRPMAQAPVWHLQELGRIGSVNDPHTSFTAPIELAVGDSEIYVVSGRPPHGARFTMDGRWLGDFAGSGNGPGELLSAQTVGITGDTVWVVDPQGTRMELYAPDGSYARSVRFLLHADSLGEASTPRALLADGSILAGPGYTNIGAVTSGRLDHATFERIDARDTAVSILYRLPVVRTDFFAASTGNGHYIMGGSPLTQTALVRVFPDGSGFVVVTRMAAQQAGTASYTVTRYAADGTVAWKTDVPYTPVSADGYLDAYLAKQNTATQPMPPAIAQAIRKGVYVPPFFPPVSDLVPGRDGTVWIRRDESNPDSVRYDILDPQGRPAARLTTAESTRLVAASATEAWGVVTDSLDVPFLVRYGVSQAPEPGAGGG